MTLSFRVFLSAALTLGAGAASLLGAPLAAVTNAPPKPALVLPMGRTAYFIGETVPLAVAGMPAGTDVRIDAVGSGGRLSLYQGKATALLLDTTHLAQGDYSLELNGTGVVARLTITPVLRRSAGSMQDEATPREETPSDDTDRILRESGLTACVALGASDMGRASYLDVMARSGALLLVNPDTRPTSFFPVGNNPEELDSMSQRVILTTEANERYPNFGGFCFGWDTTGYAVGGRRGLLTYWGWGDQTQALRNYIERLDRQKMATFTKRTGLAPVSEAEYIAYMLAIGRPEFAPAIDLPTKVWLEEIAKYIKPMPEAERARFEQRLDAWAGYMMNLYNEAYSTLSANLRGVDPSIRNTSSVQSDHCTVRSGQYFPSAYAPLDFRYQSTWNDQVGGPDYAYQWLLVSALLEMERGDKPVWISNCMGSAHGRSSLPGKMVRVAAHDLAFGGTGIGFALEGFSNLLGGMNAASTWPKIKGQEGEADVRAGRDFLDRFAALALEGRGEHGVGILWSKSQLARQNLAMGFGVPAYKALVALTRLGYTPRFVTEEDLAGGQAGDVAAFVIIGQTFPMPEKAMAALVSLAQGGKRVVVDQTTSIVIPGAVQLGLAFPFSVPGKPHSWGAPNMVRGENDVMLYERWHPELAKAFTAALGDVGHAWLKSANGIEAKVGLEQLEGGADARYVVAVNDSYIGSQADWYQVRETLQPIGAVPAGSVVYDCTEEKPLGALGPIDCDLSMSMARVFAILPRELGATKLEATQKVRAGGDLMVSVGFADKTGKPFAAVLPFHLALRRPDGTAYSDFYRSTTREGRFTMRLPIPANVPAGNWNVAVRSQLTGVESMLPVTIQAAKVMPSAVALRDAVLVQGREAVESALAKGSRVVVPLFGRTNVVQLLPVAEKVKAVLAERGVEVDIWTNPAVGSYTLAYDPTETQTMENARVERGEIIGRIVKKTLNGNDWYSSLSGWRFGRPVILLELMGAGEPNPMARSLANAGLLWPDVSSSFPGQGKAVIHGVQWAFGPRLSAMSYRPPTSMGS